jgi:hypothetical protein
MQSRCSNEVGLSRVEIMKLAHKYSALSADNCVYYHLY